MGHTLGRVCGDNFNTEFKKHVDESLANGDGWLHRWCNNQGLASHVIVSQTTTQHLPTGMMHLQVRQTLNQSGKIQQFQLHDNTATVQTVSRRRHKRFTWPHAGNASGIESFEPAACGEYQPSRLPSTNTNTNLLWRATCVSSLPARPRHGPLSDSHDVPSRSW